MDTYFWGLGIFGCLLGAILGLLRFSWDVSVAKNLKKHVGFLRFLEMKVFCSLKLLMVLLGSSWPSWAALIPNWVPTWISTFIYKVFNKLCNNRLKNVQIRAPKKCLRSLFFEIAGLRHFLPRPHFSRNFLVVFLWPFEALWVLLGRLLGFLRVSWEVSGPKTIKNIWFFKVF